MINLTRRQMMHLMGTGTAAIYLGGCALVPKRETVASSDWLDLMGPIDRTMGDTAPLNFSGDNPSTGHHVLWKKKEFIDSIGGLPHPQEKVDVVIVGGGMSGLLTSYYLRDLKPVLLEQAPRFGGNARAESWRGLDYSLATAYFNSPTPDSEIGQFFKEIGFSDYRVRVGEDPIFIDGKRYDEIWKKGTTPESRKQFVKLGRHFTDVIKGTNGQQYPDVPITDESDRAYVDRLDRMSFKAYLEKFLKAPLHPHVEKVVEHYFWSATASSSTEFSAAAGLNFFAADFDSMAVAPGGNAAIADKIMRSTAAVVPRENFRNGSLVFDVRTTPEGVQVSYLRDGKPHSLLAKKAVMSCPKFVAGRLIDDLEPQRREIYSKLRYRSYLLANVLVDQQLADSFYDLFFFDGERENLTDMSEAVRRQGITDMVYGNYAKPNQKQTVLTLFHGFPYDKARASIYADNAYTHYRAEFEKQLKADILPLLSVDPKKVVDMRIARWGHPLPIPEVGNFKRERIDWLRKPFRDKVFFVEQDNWMLPAFETCFNEATYWSEKIRAT